MARKGLRKNYKAEKKGPSRHVGGGKRSRKAHQGAAVSGKEFWDDEYADAAHLAISDEPSSDLKKYFRWMERTMPEYLPARGTSVVDVGCGNGRNLIYTCKTFGATGIGYDISEEAIVQCENKAHQEGVDAEWIARSAAGDIPAEDESQRLVLDMMVSHVLKNADRQHLIREIDRVLEPGGFLFLKTFLLDEDLNARQLLRDHPGSEPGSYIHPRIGIEEHVFTQQQLEEDLAPYFEIHKIYKSHRHRDRHGRANKRRSIMIYAQKI